MIIFLLLNKSPKDVLYSEGGAEKPYEALLAIQVEPRDDGIIWSKAARVRHNPIASSLPPSALPSQSDPSI